MKLRSAEGSLLVVLLLVGAPAAGQESPEIPQDLQETYGAFATALVEGRADDAIDFYAGDAVVLVDSEHVYRGRSAILEGFLRVYLEAPGGEGGPGTEIQVDGVVVGEGVVTLAGRYTNPSGAAGVYSNTWERQDDGSWKLAASVMTFEAPDQAPSRPTGSFSCTQVLGFSQSMEWYAGLSVVDHRAEGTRPDLSALAPDAFLPGWQGRFFMGAAVERWRDPDFPGWSGTHRLAHETPANCGRDELDRLVSNVSGAAPVEAPRFSRDTAFIERSSESFGTFDGVSFVRYTGIFRGETTLGAFRVPYEIVAPENPGLGNGTVLVEPPHFAAGTGGRDGVLGPDLLFGNGYGYASVGFGENGRNILDPTASDIRLAGEPVQAPGQPDPTGTLDEEILVEFAEALTSDPFAVEILGPVDRLYAYGVSQTAAVLLELRRAATRTERAGLFDFTLLHVAVWAPPLPDTAQFDHLKGEFEPLEGLGRVIFVESEGDLVVSSADQFRKAVGEPDYRVYEVAGAAHGRSEHNPLEHHAVARAMFVAGDQWTRTGMEPPPSTLLEEAPAGRDDPVYGFETGIARDHDHNARGGVRLPDLHLGRARFIASDSTTRPPRVPSRLAFLYGSTVDLACEPAPGSETDEPRFRAHEDYVDGFTRQVEELQRQGFLLEADAAELKERAAGSEVGRPGTCDG